MAGVRGVDGLRWACTGCAACCKAGYALGPVAPATIEALEAAGIREIWPPAAEGWTEERTHPSGETGAYLRAPDGACVFLMDDERCAIHSKVGASFKPWFCRRFPLAPIEDPNGSMVVVLPGCQGHHKTFESGPELAEAELAEAVALTPPARGARFAPEAIAVLPGRGVGLDDWMYLEGRLLGCLDDEVDPWEAVRRMRAELVRAMPGAWPEPDPAEAEQATRAAWAGVHRVLSSAGADPGGGAPHHLRVRTVLESLSRAAAAAPGNPELDDAARRWLVFNLRTAIAGKLIHASGSVLAGLGLYLVGVDLFARAWPDRPVPIEAFGVPWSMWHDLLGNRAMRATVKVLAPALVTRVIRA